MFIKTITPLCLELFMTNENEKAYSTSLRYSVTLIRGFIEFNIDVKEKNIFVFWSYDKK